jgi:hypothetical protein
MEWKRIAQFLKRDDLKNTRASFKTHKNYVYFLGHLL